MRSPELEEPGQQDETPVCEYCGLPIKTQKQECMALATGGCQE